MITTCVNTCTNPEDEDDGLATFNLGQLGKKVFGFRRGTNTKFVSGEYVTGEVDSIDSHGEFTFSSG